MTSLALLPLRYISTATALGGAAYADAIHAYAWSERFVREGNCDLVVVTPGTITTTMTAA